MDTVSFILNARIREVLADLGTWHKTRKRPLGEVQTFAKGGYGYEIRHLPVQTEDYASVLLRFSNGACGNLAVSQVAAGRKKLPPDRAVWFKEVAWWCSENPEMLHFGNRDAANEVAVRATPAFSEAAPFTDYPSGHVEGFPILSRCCTARSTAPLSMAAKTEPLFATAEDGHQEVAVCEAVMASSKPNAG